MKSKVAEKIISETSEETKQKAKDYANNLIKPKNKFIMKTLLIIAPGREATRDSVFNLLVAETGEHLASHLCSHYGFAKSDLYSSSKEKVDEYEKRFGEVEVKYIDETDITQEQLIERNKDWYSKFYIETEI